MKLLIILASFLLVAVLAGVGFAYSGLYDVGASSPHSGLANWLMSTTSRASIERRAEEIEVPDLSDAALVRAGINDFAAMCAGCHGAPGQEPEAMGQGLNPRPPDLKESAKYMTPAELFWVTKHGIRMTGMPAWGATHDDDAIWPVVAFLTTLPDLDADGYQALLASAAGAGHHSASASSAGHSHNADEPVPKSYEHPNEASDHHADALSHDAAPNDHGAHDHAEPAPATDKEEQDDGHDHTH